MTKKATTPRWTGNVRPVQHWGEFFRAAFARTVKETDERLANARALTARTTKRKGKE